MTLKGKNRLEEELSNLKLVKRPEIIQAISSARELGDLSENAEYHYAKEKQGFIEGRIAYLESRINNSEVIDITKIKSDLVKFGAFVKLCDVKSSEEVDYQIVGVDESDIASGLLSIESPLAKHLIGKEEGDVVLFKTQSGEKKYEIISVEYREF